MKNCNEIEKFISLYIDGELDDNLRQELEEHLEGCESCRNEVRELQQVVSLCGSLGEEELPEDFKQQLHEKLVSVSAENAPVAGSASRNDKKINIYRYAKIATTIAAVLLIAVMLKVLFPTSKMYDNSTATKQVQESGMDSSSAAAGVEENKGNEQEAALDVKEQYGENVEVGSIPGESNGTAVAREEKAEEPVKKVNPAEKPKIKARQYTVKAPEEKAKTDAPPAQTQMLMVKEVAKNVARDAHITVKVENPEAEIEDLKAKALEYGAESEGTEADQAAFTVTTVSTGAALTFKIPFDKYDAFVAALKNSFGEASVAGGTVNEKSIDDDIKKYDAQLKEKKDRAGALESAGTAPEDQELVSLKAEIASLQKELDSLMSRMKYVSVSMEILHK